MPLRHFTLVALVLTAACSSPAEIAEKTGRISWEVLTSVSRRVPRFYREP